MSTGDRGASGGYTEAESTVEATGDTAVATTGVAMTRDGTLLHGRVRKNESVLLWGTGGSQV